MWQDRLGESRKMTTFSDLRIIEQLARLQANLKTKLASVSEIRGSVTIREPDFVR
jgi:hypothetical protein